ncbi:MAG: TetR/AcrR family transcriptional regulator [Acidimicrobiales bacterium]
MARETRRAILEATLAFLEAGDAGFTYESLAGRARVARQTLYSQFPDRAQLFVAAVDHARERLGADELSVPVYEAATARGALDALLDFHVAYTPAIMRPARVVEARRAGDPELSRRFEERPSGRRQITRHVVNRLAAEGELAPEWSVERATDFLSALMTASFTSDLLEERGWTTSDLRSSLGMVVATSILAPSAVPTTADEGGAP